MNNNKRPLSESESENEEEPPYNRKWMRVTPEEYGGMHCFRRCRDCLNFKLMFFVHRDIGGDFECPNECEGDHEGDLVGVCSHCRPAKRFKL